MVLYKFCVIFLYLCPHPSPKVTNCFIYQVPTDTSECQGDERGPQVGRNVRGCPSSHLLHRPQRLRPSINLSRVPWQQRLSPSEQDDPESGSLRDDDQTLMFPKHPLHPPPEQVRPLRRKNHQGPPRHVRLAIRIQPRPALPQRPVSGAASVLLRGHEVQGALLFRHGPEALRVADEG